MTCYGILRPKSLGQLKSFNFSVLLFYMEGNQARFVKSSDSDIKKLVANAVPENMNQKRRVFEFLISGALRELISHNSLSSFGPWN